ncbi:MAG: YceI family protein [Thermoanaerobaculia bacterium]
MKLIPTLLLTALAATPLFAADAPAAEVFSVDKGHSSVEFKVRHVVANVTGRFNDFDATVNINRANPAASTVEFAIKAASIDTANENRDKHLRSADFFDVEKFPAITFKSTAVKASKQKDVYDVTGDFTMHGVTKRITLPVSFLGFGKDPWGNERAGFEIETTLDRKDYGITWNKALDAGGALLSDDVKVAISLAAVKKK